MSEWNLSDKKIGSTSDPTQYEEIYKGSDVKEFIKRLKESCHNKTDEELYALIDKLAGEKLI